MATTITAAAFLPHLWRLISRIGEMRNSCTSTQRYQVWGRHWSNIQWVLGLETACNYCNLPFQGSSCLRTAEFDTNIFHRPLYPCIRPWRADRRPSDPWVLCRWAWPRPHWEVCGSGGAGTSKAHSIFPWICPEIQKVRITSSKKTIHLTCPSCAD